MGWIGITGVDEDVDIKTLTDVGGCGCRFHFSVDYRLECTFQNLCSRRFGAD